MRIDIKRVCVPTDFSDVAEHAIHYGAALAEKFGAEFHLLHVVHDFEELASHPDFTAHGELARKYFEDLEWDATARSEGKTVEQATEDEEARKFLRTMENGLEEQFEKLPREDWWEQLTIYRAVRYGNTVEQICQYAHKQAIDILVLGTRGRGGIKRLLVGSVAERVVRSSPVPVLTVHPREEREFVRED